jgi:hypothetical protein
MPDYDKKCADYRVSRRRQAGLWVSLEGTAFSLEGAGFSLDDTGLSVENTDFSLEGMGFSLEGTGFSPYIKDHKTRGALAPEASLDFKLSHCHTLATPSARTATR